MYSNFKRGIHSVLICLKSAFLKLWSMDHQWSSKSVLVILKKYRRKIKIQMNCASHCSWKSQSFEMTHGNRLSRFLPVLTLYEIYYPIYLPTSHSTLRTKEGFKALWTWCFSPSFPCKSGTATCNPARHHPNS